MNYIELYNKEVDEEILRTLGKPQGDDTFIELLYLLETPVAFIEQYIENIIENTRGYIESGTLYRFIFEEAIMDIFYRDNIPSILGTFPAHYESHKASNSRDIILKLYWDDINDFENGKVFSSFVKKLFEDIDIVKIVELVENNVRSRDQVNK